MEDDCDEFVLSVVPEPLLCRTKILAPRSCGWPVADGKSVPSNDLHRGRSDSLVGCVYLSEFLYAIRNGEVFCSEQCAVRLHSIGPVAGFRRPNPWISPPIQVPCGDDQ